MTDTGLITKDLDRKISLERTSLIRPIFRALLESGRAYAAFKRDRTWPLLLELREKGPILDPMAGYGSLMRFCAEAGVRSYSLELNPVAYLWTLLNHPSNTIPVVKLASRLRDHETEWPRAPSRAVIAARWFAPEAVNLLHQLFCVTRSLAPAEVGEFSSGTELALALLLPFSGRFACGVPGNVSTRVKPGGFCVFRDWHEDFQSYLDALVQRVTQGRRRTREPDQVVRHGDCRSFALPPNAFRAMITSPPYPNREDYSKMFAPELELLGALSREGLIGDYTSTKALIGSVHVSRPAAHSRRQLVSSSAQRFLETLPRHIEGAKGHYDYTVYYEPYYRTYFEDIERAYTNVAASVAGGFAGYIIVTNNTARGLVIPVAEAICEIWRELGFRSHIVDEWTEEKFHVGAINPRARGIRAKHVEYIIKVERDGG